MGKSEAESVLHRAFLTESEARRQQIVGHKADNIADGIGHADVHHTVQKPENAVMQSRSHNANNTETHHLPKRITP